MPRFPPRPTPQPTKARPQTGDKATTRGDKTDMLYLLSLELENASNPRACWEVRGDEGESLGRAGGTPACKCMGPQRVSVVERLPREGLEGCI